MAYVNPFDLLDAPFQPPLDASRLKRERKRLMAEFDLSQEVEISIGGHHLDRASVIRLFDELENHQTQDFHYQVHQDAALSGFLGEATLDLFYDGGVGQLANREEEFLRWIAPFFAESFNKRLVNAVKQSDLEETRVLCQAPLPIPAAYQAACFQDSYRYLHEQIKEVDALTKSIDKGGAPTGKVQEVCDEMLIDLLNLLPTYFDGVRDRYGLALEALALSVQNQHQRVQLSILIVKQGLKLRISDDTRSRLQYILDQLMKLAPMEGIIETLTSDSPDSKNRRKQLIWWAVGIGTAIVLLAGWLL